LCVELSVGVFRVPIWEGKFGVGVVGRGDRELSCSCGNKAWWSVGKEK